MVAEEIMSCRARCLSRIYSRLAVGVIRKKSILSCRELRDASVNMAISRAEGFASLCFYAGYPSQIDAMRCDELDVNPCPTVAARAPFVHDNLRYCANARVAVNMSSDRHYRCCIGPACAKVAQVQARRGVEGSARHRLDQPPHRKSCVENN